MEDKANSFNNSTAYNSLEQPKQLESQVSIPDDISLPIPPLAETTEKNQDLKKCQEVLLSIGSKNIFNAQQDVYTSTYPKNWPFQIFTPYSGLRRSSRLSKPIHSANISLDLPVKKEEYLQTNKFIDSIDLKENLDNLKNFDQTIDDKSFLNNTSINIGKKTRRSKPKTKVLLEIRKFRKTTRHMIPRSPFSRIFKEILQNVSKPGSNLNVELKAIDALHESSEAFLTTFYEAAHRCAIHAKRETVKPQDFNLVWWILNAFGTAILR
ncbi:hypothetical protein ACQ4LE_001780 [Meloidogyne hapla]